MTINSTCISNNERRYRLPFGVPLEDIFPHNDIHPYLRQLVVKSYRDIILNGYAIEEVIRKLQGSIAERLLLKEIVVSCKPMPPAIPPGALLWILRHFLGLLPLPLLPDYADGQRFTWGRLAQFCRRSFMKYSTVGVNNRLLINKLAEDLARLPPVNLLLFAFLLNFFRTLSEQRKGRREVNFNRLAAFYLVRYFSSSIFLRPYKPGQISKLDRQYFPLLLYFILKWPAIKKELKLGKTVTPKQLVSNTRYCIESPVIKVKIKDCATQTEDYCESNDNYSDVSENISYKSFTIDSNVEVDDLDIYLEIPIKEDCTFLKDTACQTQSVLNEYGFNKSNWLHCEKSIRCCCLYGKNYESSLNESGILDKCCQTNLVEEEIQEITTEVRNKCDAGTSTGQVLLNKNTQCDINRIKTKFKVDVATNTYDLPYYGWISPSKSAEDSPIKVELCSPKTFISDNQYIYDDYISSTLNLLDNPEDAASAEAENDLLERISKIGWTYTPPRSVAANSPLVSPTTLSKKTSKDENYTLCFNEKEQVKEEKEECSSRESLKSRQSLANISSAKSRRSFIVANIKSKFDFLKIFSGKKSKLKGSCSYDSMSNIKYKKMNSARSTMF